MVIIDSCQPSGQAGSESATERVAVLMTPTDGAPAHPHGPNQPILVQRLQHPAGETRDRLQ